MKSKHTHYGTMILLAGLLVSAGVEFIPLPSPWHSISDYALFLPIIAGFAMSMKHGRNLCERCIEEMPLDPEAAVKKRRWVLRTCHFLSEVRHVPRLRKPVHYTSMHALLLVLILLSVVCSFVFGRSLITTASGSLISLLMVAGIGSNITHARLQLWCPWCGYGRGGDDEREDTPTPSEPVNA